MNQYNILPIGTRITNTRHGDGYILGNAHLRNNIYRKNTTDVNKPPMLVYYLTYFPSNKVRRYLAAKQFTVIESTNDINRDTALSYLPLVVNPIDIIHENKVPVGDANYYLGDWVRTDLFGEGIILSEGFYRPGQTGQSIYHHIYFPKTGIFEFEKERYQTLIRLADDKSRQQAKDIIRNQILMPAFS